MPTDSEYASILGQAVFAFSSYEWNVVNITHRLSPGFLSRYHEYTAGQIGTEFEKAILANPNLQNDQRLHNELLALRQEFRSDVKIRNKLLHSTPATYNGEQRLVFRENGRTRDWSCGRLNEFIESVRKNNGTASRLLHGPMSRPPYYE